MQKQKGPCAYAASCVVPGPRVRVPGTNQNLCAMHFRTMQSPTPSGAGDAGFTRTEVRPARRRTRWATYVGIADLV
jgi:hypothetical protein